MDDAIAESSTKTHLQTGQMLGSLAVALLIVGGVIYAVTARRGPTGKAEQRIQEKLDEQRQEQAEETGEERARDERNGFGSKRGRGSGRDRDEEPRRGGGD